MAPGEQVTPDRYVDRAAEGVPAGRTGGRAGERGVSVRLRRHGPDRRGPVSAARPGPGPVPGRGYGAAALRLPAGQCRGSAGQGAGAPDRGGERKSVVEGKGGAV